MRAVQVALLTATAFASLGIAAPAMAQAAARSPQVMAAAPPVARPVVAGPALPLCIDLDVQVLLRLRLVLGACRDDGPAEPDPPAPAPTSPAPPASPRPPSPAPPRPAPPASAEQAGTPGLVALPREPGATPAPATRRPAPAPATPSPESTGYRAPAPRGVAPARHRRSPLDSTTVLVVLSTVIASGAGLAFAARR